MPSQLALPFADAPSYAAADYIAAPGNALARDFLGRPADWTNGRLVLWGEAGCGKTHLATIWAQDHGALLLRGASLPPLAGPPAGALVIDDSDHADETALFHLLNAAAEARKLVLLTARMPPARQDIRLPDLASRLRASLTIEIPAPDQELLTILLTRLAADRQLIIPDRIQQFLLTRLPRTLAAFREAVARLDHAALAAGGKVTRTLAAKIVADMAGRES
jgi:chromosomal replication initiation ATPase DnaA